MEVFPPVGEEWCVVDRKDVVIGKENKGLVKLIKSQLCDDGNHTNVLIKDNADMKLSWFRVPLEEVQAGLKDE